MNVKLGDSLRAWLDRIGIARHKPPMASNDLSALTFEDALKRLEAIVQRLESGDATLDESIDLYAEGDRLRGQCETRLQAAQARIEKIALGPDGKPSASTAFDGD